MSDTNQVHIRLKRAYEPPVASDGARVLIDRLWPRGMAKQVAAIDHWFRDHRPSTELRRRFRRYVARWEEFQRRYTDELTNHTGEFEELLRLAARRTITLVVGAPDEEHNDAVD